MFGYSVPQCNTSNIPVNLDLWKGCPFYLLTCRQVRKVSSSQQVLQQESRYFWKNFQPCSTGLPVERWLSSRKNLLRTELLPPSLRAGETSPVDCLPLATASPAPAGSEAETEPTLPLVAA